MKVDSGWFSELKSVIFAGFTIVLLGICLATVARSAPVMVIPLGKKLTTHKVDWPANDCRPNFLRLKVLDGAVSIVQVEIRYTSRRTQIFKSFSALDFAGTITRWMSLDGELKDSSPQCIDHLLVTAVAAGGKYTPLGRLQVEAR